MSDMRLIEGEEWYRVQHAEIVKLRAEIERLRAERDEWKAKWISLAQASFIAGTMTLEQKADTE